MNEQLLQINPDLEILFDEYKIPPHLGDHFLAVYLLEDTDESEKEELIEIFETLIRETGIVHENCVTVYSGCIEGINQVLMMYRNNDNPILRDFVKTLTFHYGMIFLKRFRTDLRFRLLDFSQVTTNIENNNMKNHFYEYHIDRINEGTEVFNDTNFMIMMSDPVLKQIYLDYIDPETGEEEEHYADIKRIFYEVVTSYFNLYRRIQVNIDDETGRPMYRNHIGGKMVGKKRKRKQTKKRLKD
tara:strand:- start:7085 stop:7813 length:729 start_codon:yes stop_codon:yes gene_type:complete